eukprot:TRINITY_DN947_c0_g1_i23.p1 TRINITY_DN947_c0_g1~~TRINITY_DN947_c0_g1_i23.p1  ORF type:complete len:556 (+),score=105.11 TRINITY_DN947_c0_g1_i23:902-2569(+)
MNHNVISFRQTHSRLTMPITRPSRNAAVDTDAMTINELFNKAVEKFPSKDALCVKRDGKWKKWTYTTYHDEVFQAGKALIACGLEQGKGISIISFNSPEWYFAALGAIHVGGILSGIYTTNSPDQCQYIVSHSDSQVVFVEDLKQLAKFRLVRKDLPNVKEIVLMDDSKDPENWAISWSHFLKRGESVSESAFTERRDKIKKDDVCSLIYTSGTTGNPKGVMITHSNVTWVGSATLRLFDLTSDEHIMSYLPLSHVAEQSISLFCPLQLGGTVWFANPEVLKAGLTELLAEVRPTVFFGVPRVWEKIEATLKGLFMKATGMKKKLLAWSMACGEADCDRMQENRSRPWNYGIYNKLFYSKLKTKLGLDRARYLFTAAAPINRSTLRFFHSIGLPVFEIYGMSECSGPATCNSPGWYKLGTVGSALPNTELRIFDDGEICYRGPHIFKGYWKDPDATANTIDKDGFLHSGDIGVLDSEGFLTITDRKKELLITAGGENIAPAVIESMMRQVPGISQFVVFGDRQKYLVGLIVMDVDSLQVVNRILGTSVQSIKDAS